MDLGFALLARARLLERRQARKLLLVREEQLFISLIAKLLKNLLLEIQLSILLWASSLPVFPSSKTQTTEVVPISKAKR